MKRKGKFIVLTYRNMAPCILRADKIKDVREAPAGGSRIRYTGGREFEVQESRFEVWRMVE